MGDEQTINLAKQEVWSVDKQIEELIDKEGGAALHLCKSIKWLEMQPRRDQQLAGAQAATVQLRNLAMMAMHLEEAYSGNATHLVASAQDSANLAWTDKALAVCYFVMAVSKVTDAAAQYYGGPYASLITSLKTPIADMGKEQVKNFNANPRDMTFTLSGAQTMNFALLLATAGAPGQGETMIEETQALQKGLAAITEVLKDSAELLKTGKDWTEMKSALRPFLVKAVEKITKLVDLTTRLLTLYTSGLTLAPELTKKILPATVTSPEFIKKANSRRTFLTATKYLAEAALNFVQFGLSLADMAENISARDTSLALADRNLMRTGGGAFSADTQMFAHATQTDLIRMIHTVNSAGDAHDMARGALVKIKELGAEIEQMSKACDRHGYFWGLNLQTISGMKAKLGESDKNLDQLRQKLSSGPDAASYDVKEWLPKIDDARGKIARILSPAPNWIEKHGRFGPRVGPQ